MYVLGISWLIKEIWNFDSCLVSHYNYFSNLLHFVDILIKLVKGIKSRLVINIDISSRFPKNLL